MLAAISAGAFYLCGTKEGAKRRVKVRGWGVKAKGEEWEKIEKKKGGKNSLFSKKEASKQKEGKSPPFYTLPTSQERRVS